MRVLTGETIRIYENKLNAATKTWKANLVYTITSYVYLYVLRWLSAVRLYLPPENEWEFENSNIYFNFLAGIQ